MADTYTQRFSEVHDPAGVLYPANRAANAYTTGWISLQNNQRMVFQIAVGVIAAGGTVNFAVTQATTVGGAGAKAIAGKNITQLTQAGGDVNELALIEIRTEELDVNGGFCYVQGTLTVGVNTAYTAVIPLRGVPNYPPVTVANWTEVVD